MLPKPLTHPHHRPREMCPDGDDVSADLLDKTSKQLSQFSNGGRFINNECFSSPGSLCVKY